MYHGAGDPRGARRALDTPAGFDPEATGRAVLARIRKLLDAYAPGTFVERKPPDALLAPLKDAGLERERLFLLGWLHWLGDAPAAAEPMLAEATRQARESGAVEALAEAAYWTARVRLLLGRGEALAEFEGVLRALGGSPRATAWFVDLLGRAGRTDRAGQVWKSVRGNRRVAGCPEGPLLEARLLLRRGETAPAERLLAETAPAAGAVWVERLLLLAWIAAAQKQYEKAGELLRRAGEGPYPDSALRTWAEMIARRSRDEPAAPTTGVPPALRDFVRGQQARREGRADEAAAAYQAALDSPPAQPFARYALACLGRDDFAAVLAGQPGLFLAVRCRARLAVERFRRREIGPAECLDALRQAEPAGYGDEPFRPLAAALQERRPDPASLRRLAEGPTTDPAARNTFRAAVELAGRLPPEDARGLLLEWAAREDLDPGLRTLVGRHLLREALRAGADAAMSAALERLLPGEPLLALVNDNPSPATGSDVPSLALRAGGNGETPALRLWDAARTIDRPPEGPERWRERVRPLRSSSRWKGPAQALLLQEAAGRGDVSAVLELLDEADAWRGLEAPPRFVLRALAHLAAAQPGQPGWVRGLGRWLKLWEPSSLGSTGAALAAHAGLAEMRADTAEPPPGVPTVPWLLHQAARALGRDDAVLALTLARRALALDPDLAGVAASPAVRDALPELERRALAQYLARIVRPDGGEVAPGVLADAVDALAEVPEGAAVLDALAGGDAAAARGRLDALCERPDLPPRLAHHLALLMTRAAEAREEREQTDAAEPCWRRAWACWLRFLTAGEVDAAARPLLLDHLLAGHRRRLNDLLARNAVDAARRHWDLVAGLTAPPGPAADELAERVGRFREELATEHLLTTREAMRYGTVPEGWRADYEKGLGYLRRLLSLDRDNVRLLTALVEICNDWFLDLYHLGRAAPLREQVERFTPFALQLARRVGERDGEGPARTALSDFWKFRGFLAAERDRKAALYREALRFNPANANVRDLLAEMSSE